MKKSSFIVTTASLFILSSCAMAPSQLGMSLISETKEPLLVTSNKKGKKEGKACGKNILGFYSHGDMSVEKARKNGGINNITSVDKTVRNTVFISDVCTIVRGN